MLSWTQICGSLFPGSLAGTDRSRQEHQSHVLSVINTSQGPSRPIGLCLADEIVSTPRLDPSKSKQNSVPRQAVLHGIEPT